MFVLWTASCVYVLERTLYWIVLLGTFHKSVPLKIFYKFVLLRTTCIHALLISVYTYVILTAFCVYYEELYIGLY
jgi:hypothetical protein